MDRPNPSHVKPGNRAGLAALLLVAASLLYSLWFYLDTLAGVPSDDDWKHAGALVKSRFQQGDAVAVTPYWAFQGEAALRGLPVTLTQEPQSESFGDAARLWVVSGFDRFDGGLGEMTARPGVTYREHASFGGVAVDLLDLGAQARTNFDFGVSLDRAEAYMLYDGRKQGCGPMRDGRFVCSDNDWNWVGLTRRFIDNTMRQVIWAHPEGSSVNLQFIDVPAGKKLYINTALTLFGATLPEGTPVFIDVYIDGVLRQSVEQPNTSRMTYHVIDLGEAADAPRDIRFSIRSPQNGRRHFVFQAYTR